MRIGRLVVFAAVATTLLFPATEGLVQESNELVEPIGVHGSINWSTGIITATGIGSPKYFRGSQMQPLPPREALLYAYRNLLEATKGVRIDSTTMVRDSMVESDVIQSQVRGMVKEARIVKREFLSDGTVEVTIAMDLHGGFAQLMLPRDIKQVPEIKVVPPRPPKAQAPTIYTGLVVDARGLNARPAMSLKINDENGREVYGSAYVSREFAVQQGMAGYAKDLTASQTNPRVTNEPLTVKALRTEGPGQSDFVISNADAAKTRSDSENLIFLKKCRVMVVLD